jgi:hypothetical protein
MKLSKIITIDGRDITVKELTVEEICNCMDAVTTGQQVDTLDVVMDGALPAEAVVRACGIDRAALSALTPSALLPIWEAAAEVNPFFARMVAKPEAPAANPSGNR